MRVRLLSIICALLIGGWVQESSAQSSGKMDPNQLVNKPSGLRFFILKNGKGPAAKNSDRVLVHYSGWLTNGAFQNGTPKKGKMFDSSYKRNRPFSCRIGVGLIKGFSEGLAGMKVGEKRRLFIPPHIAYGKRGAGRLIPPNSELIFEIELLRNYSQPGKVPPPRRARPKPVVRKPKAKALKRVAPKPKKRMPAKRKPKKRAKPKPRVKAETMKGKYKLVTSATTLKYIDWKIGKGRFPKKSELVQVHYVGWILLGYYKDGTPKKGKMFDSSVKRGVPITFAIGEGKVIKGWDEGIGSMRVGGRRTLIIPPKIGYGVRGIGKFIPANSTLIFDVQLLAIRPPER